MSARRGDIAVIVETSVDYMIGRAPQTRERATVGIVTSITREGIVKAVETVCGQVAGVARNPRMHVLTVPKSDIDVAAVIAAATAHHWPGHPDQPMPYGSVAEVRRALRPFLTANAA